MVELLKDNLPWDALVVEISEDQGLWLILSVANFKKAPARYVTMFI